MKKEILKINDVVTNIAIRAHKLECENAQHKKFNLIFSGVDEYVAETMAGKYFSITHENGEVLGCGYLKNYQPTTSQLLTLKTSKGENL